MKILDFFKTRKLSYWLSAAALVLTLIAFIVYLTTAKTSTPFITSYSTQVIVSFCIALGIGIFSLIITLKEVLYLQFVINFFTLGSFIASLIELFGGMAYGEETAVLPGSTVTIAVCVLVTCILALVAGIMKKDNRSGGNYEEVV